MAEDKKTPISGANSYQAIGEFWDNHDLADLSKAQGKQELFTHQSPQKLKVLCEHALIESAISSNRIEGINVDQSRINTLILGKAILKDRNEEEVSGYRDALRLIHEKAG